MSSKISSGLFAAIAMAGGVLIARDSVAQQLRDGRDCTEIGSAFFAAPAGPARVPLLLEFQTTRFGKSAQSCAQSNPKTFENMRGAINVPPKPAAAVTPSSGLGGPAIVTATSSGGQRCAPNFDYTNYKQFTGEWADDRVNPRYQTFSRTACYLTAWTTAMGYYGYTYNPKGLRDALNKMQESGTDAWRDGRTGYGAYPTKTALTKLTKGGTLVLKNGVAGNKAHNPTMVEAVRKHFCVDKHGEPMIGGVDYGKEEDDDNERGDHFVTIIGFEDGQPLVLDPGSTQSGLSNNAKVKGGTRLNEINRRGGYFLAKVEYVE